jgi:hypothetical protein
LQNRYQKSQKNKNLSFFDSNPTKPKFQKELKFDIRTKKRRINLNKNG